MNRELLTIVMTTWAPDGDIGRARQDYAKLALASWLSSLKYDGQVRVHVADDGSDLPGFPACLAAVYEEAVAYRPTNEWAPEISFGEPTPRLGLGGSLNAGFRAAFQVSPFVAYFADDWALTAPLDLTPWATLLERPDVGVVRLLPHPDLTGTVMHLGELGWAVRLDRHHFVCGMRPALYHQRFNQAYGWWDEKVNVYDCEVGMNQRFCDAPARDSPLPDIVLALPHPWEHIGWVEVNAVQPGVDG